MRFFIALAALVAPAYAAAPTAAEFLMAGTGKENTLTTLHGKLAPSQFIGGCSNDATLAYLAAIALAYGTNPEETLALVKGWGVVLLVAMRSKAAWQTRNYYEQTPSERAFSLSAAQWAAMAAVLLSCFQIAFMSVDGGSLPEHGAVLGALFINTMRSMGMCGTTPDKKGRFSRVISATQAGLFAMELALSDPDARAAAVALSFKYNLGPIMIAACVFGTFDDVLALTYPLTLAIIGKPDAYRPVMSGILYPMLAALATTTYAASLFAELYGLGFCRMAVQFADCGLSPGGATGSRRGVSPWLILAAMPSALVGVTMSAASGIGHTFGVSNANLGLIWQTHLMVFACVAYRLFNNMGCWEADMATTLVIPTGARGEFARAMRALVRFLFRGAGIVKPKPEPKPDEKKPKLPWWWWISLIFGMSARLLLFGTIPTLADCGGDAGMLARRARALYLIGLMEQCEAITVVRYDDGSFVAFFQPNAGIAALTNFWPARPESIDALQRDGVDMADPSLMGQIPAYSDPRDATTGALLANQAGSWRRNQLRLEAGVNVPWSADI